MYCRNQMKFSYYKNNSSISKSLKLLPPAAIEFWNRFLSDSHTSKNSASWFRIIGHPSMMKGSSLLVVHTKQLGLHDISICWEMFGLNILSHLFWNWWESIHASTTWNRSITRMASSKLGYSFCIKFTI